MTALNASINPGPGGPFVTAETLLLTQAAVLTTGYTASDSVRCVGWDYSIFRFPYTVGDETSMTVDVQGTTQGDKDDTSAVWSSLGYKAVQSSGVSELTKDPLKITAANYSGADGIYTPPYVVRGLHRVRVRIKATGGTPTGTIGAYAILGKTMTQ